MKINEVVLSEVDSRHSDAAKQARELHIQKRISGVAVDTKNTGKDMGTSAATGVEVGDLANVAKKGTKDADLGKTSSQSKQKQTPEPKQKPSGPSSDELRRKAQTDLLRGRTTDTDTDTPSSGIRTGSDGRELKHDKFYRKQGVGVKDYDSVLPTLGIKKGVDTAKKYAANFVRNPSDTMADLRYKFKDLLQK